MRPFIILLTLALLIPIANGCSTGGDIVSPTYGTSVNRNTGGAFEICLGQWQIGCDTVSGGISITVMRGSAMILNVLQFLEPPVNVTLSYNPATVVIKPAQKYVGVDVILKHPFVTPKHVFHGFDVRGIVMGPDVLNADGFTPVMNPADFQGVPYGYKDGLLGQPDSVGHYEGIWGYKYFTNALGNEQELGDFFSNPDNLALRGAFLEGTQCSRRYELSWAETAPPINFFVFNYAVYANYHLPSGTPPYGIEHYPISTANSAEAFCASITEASNSLYYINDSGGGEISLDVELFDWQGFDGTEVTLFADGAIPETPPVLASTGSTPKSFVYHFIDVPGQPIEAGPLDIYIKAVDPVTFGEAWFQGLLPPGHEMYNENLFVLFRHTAEVSNNTPPECDFDVVTPRPASGPAPLFVTFDAGASYDPDGGPVLLAWDFNGDGVYDGPEDSYTGSAAHPIHDYIQTYIGDVWLRVTDDEGSISECSRPVDVTVETNVLFHWLGDWGTGDPMIAPPDYNNYWEYVPEDMVWDENGNTHGMATICTGTTWIHTPSIAIPDESSGSFDVLLRLRHWGGANPPWLFDPNPAGFDSGGFVGYRFQPDEEWFINSDLYPWLAHAGGMNFNSVNPMNLAIGGDMAWCPYLGVNYGPDVWNERAFGAKLFQNLWGSPTNIWESIFKIDETLKGQAIEIGFYWGGLEEDMGKAEYPGWCIREIEVYLEPK